MNILERSVRKLDNYQQRHRTLSFIFAVTKRDGDINGGNLVSLLTYSMFLTIFPLFLMLITILTLVLAGDPALKQTVLNSTFSQFPVVGSQLGSNIHVLRRDSVIGLVVALVALVYGSIGLARSGIFAMQEVWSIKPEDRLNYVKSLGRGVLFLLVLGLGVTLTTLLSFFGTYSKRNLALAIVSQILAAIVNIFIYLIAFRALTPKKIATSDMVSGAIFGGIAWTILVAFGGYIVGHYLKNDNATYGVFGTVLGLIAWLYLGARVTVYAVEANYVKKHHRWPRSLLEPTKPD